MNIFLDTTLTYIDPFLKKNYNRNLLKLAKENKEITFYMSNVVFKETRRHLVVNIKEKLELINKTNNELSNFSLESYHHRDIDKEVEKLVQYFDEFYNKIQEENALIIVNCPDEILPELIERSVNRIKPFKENKSEFRDAATWLTYTKYAEEKNLNNCYFISNNTTDFYDEEKKNIHPELYSDSEKFIPYYTLTKLAKEDETVKAYLEEKIKEEQEIINWLEEKNVNEGYVKKMFYNQPLHNDLLFICSDYISDLDPHHLNPEFYLYEFGEIETSGIDILDVQDLTSEIIAKEVIISGELVINAECNFVESDDLNINGVIESFELELLLNFSFKLSRDNTITNMQLENLRKIGKAKVDFTKYF